jgi:hypothetical protein
MYLQNSAECIVNVLTYFGWVRCVLFAFNDAIHVPEQQCNDGDSAFLLVDAVFVTVRTAVVVVFFPCLFPFPVLPHVYEVLIFVGGLVFVFLFALIRLIVFLFFLRFVFLVPFFL